MFPHQKNARAVYPEKAPKVETKKQTPQEDTRPRGGRVYLVLVSEKIVLPLQYCYPLKPTEHHDGFAIVSQSVVLIPYRLPINL